MSLKKFGVEGFKFTVYLAVPVMAYMFFENRDRVKAFIARVNPVKRIPPELHNVIPHDLEDRLARGEHPEDIAAQMEVERKQHIEKKHRRMAELREQAERYAQLQREQGVSTASASSPTSR